MINSDSTKIDETSHLISIAQLKSARAEVCGSHTYVSQGSQGKIRYKVDGKVHQAICNDQGHWRPTIALPYSSYSFDEATHAA
ncbi:hypothetical protein ECG_00960 [Echinococcus granulosus]|nr:hypothetical protein ECG_00960 [Echinococcus granulosus]